tara:strand:+ start:162 stop:770 length:609 start_codon:yes stop_codon:yes gene_type:complete
MALELLFESFFTGHRAANGHDDNKGLGYGQIKNVHHKPRKANNSYPYREPDHEDLEDFSDKDSEKAVASKTLKVFKTDPLDYKSADSFYYVAGNTKLSDCFERIDSVLEEVHAMGDSMYSVPHAYKAKKKTNLGSSGASFPSGVGSYRRTGTKKGYFSSPPRLKIDDDNREEDESIENLLDLADKQTTSSGTFSKRKDIFNQ